MNEWMSADGKSVLRLPDDAEVVDVTTLHDELQTFVLPWGQWIPCKLQMPPENTPVLAWDAHPREGGSAIVADYDMRADGPCWGESLNHEYRVWFVTHWMPLPPPPEKPADPKVDGASA